MNVRVHHRREDGAQGQMVRCAVAGQGEGRGI
jgi:hypothetical protein